MIKEDFVNVMKGNKKYVCGEGIFKESEVGMIGLFLKDNDMFNIILV